MDPVSRANSPSGASARASRAQPGKAALPGARLLERADAPAGEFALLTGPMTRAELDGNLDGVKPLSVFRVLD